MSLIKFNYENKNIRTLKVDNNPWFVSKDVCDILGFKNNRQALKDNVNEEFIKKYGDFENVKKNVSQNYSLKKSVKLISEEGLYCLLMSCKLKNETIKKFKKWVVSVIKEIRKTGKYEINNEDKEPLYNEQDKEDEDIKNLNLLSEKLHLVNHNKEIIKEYGLYNKESDITIINYFDYIIKKHLEDSIEKKEDNKEIKKETYYTISDRIYHKNKPYDKVNISKIGLIACKLYRQLYNTEPKKRTQIINGKSVNINCYKESDFTDYIDDIIKNIYEGKPESLKKKMKLKY